MQPKVSVIIPVYNAEKYLRQCLDSVINQTLKEIEIICVDDGSTDSSLNVLEEYRSSDSRMVIIHQENSGAAVARNKGLDLAKGEFISVLDADDFFDPDMLSRSVNRLNNTDADFCVFRCRLYNDKTGTFDPCNWSIKKHLLPRGNVIKTDSVDAYIFQFANGWAWDKVFKRELIEKHDIRFNSTRIFNDTYFTFMAMALSDSFCIINDVLATKRADNNYSITSTRSKYWLEFPKVIDSLSEGLHHYGLYDKLEKSFINYALHLSLVVYKGADDIKKREIGSYLKETFFREYHIGDHPQNYFYDASEYNLYKKINGELSIMETQYKRLVDANNSNITAGKSIIPVVFATDVNYAKYTATSIDSILMSSLPDTHYRFYVLHGKGLKAQISSILGDIVCKYDNAEIEYLEIGSEFDDADICISHITTPTYYRLLLPKLLKEDKCIYLDGDIIVCSDLSEMFSIDLGNNYVGGVEAYNYYRNAEQNRERLGLDSFTCYLNAGVLLLNLKKMREDNMSEVFLSLLDKKYSSQDQDILNVACYGKLQTIPYYYNVMTKHVKKYNAYVSKYIPAREFEEYTAHPRIIHYADSIKPWDVPSDVLASYWWEAVLNGNTVSLYKDKILFLLQNNNAKKSANRNPSPGLERITNHMPRKIRGFIHCCEDHGLGYTIKYALNKKL